MTREQRWQADDLYELTLSSGGFLVRINPPTRRTYGFRVRSDPYESPIFWSWGGSPIRSYGSFGPNYAYGESATDAIQASTRILQIQMNSYYVLDVEFPQNPDKLADWKLEVVDRQGLPRKDVSVAYPSRLPACSH
jgi:hypothetical protein